MTNTKITKRERYTQIIDILTTVEADADLVAFCQNEIDLLDKKSAKAKEAAATKKAEADTLQESVREALATLEADEYASIAEVTEMVANGDENITAHKVQYRLNQLVKAGDAVSADRKIAGGEGVKARTVKTYRLVD